VHIPPKALQAVSFLPLASEVLAAFSLDATGVPVQTAAVVVELPCRYTHSGHCITSQSNELATGITELVQHFHSFIGGVHIGARALLDINLIWFGYIARLSQ
jgi:hypothetical protein